MILPRDHLRTPLVHLTLLLLAGGILAPPHAWAIGKTDPATGRIRLLIIGESTPQEPYFVTMYANDPRINLRGVVTAGDYADPKTTARFIRIFMPRTETRFLESHDVVELVDFVPWSLRDYHIEWLHQAVKAEGIGMTLCQMGWYPYLSHKYTSNDPEAWMATTLYNAYPVDMVVGKQNRPSVYHEIVEKTPVVSMPGFERFRLGGSHGLVFARPGAKVHTRWKTGKEDAICSIPYGEGLVLWYPNGWNTIPNDVARGWKYFVDFVLNQIYFVADVPVPEDPELAHSLRSAFKLYVEHKSLVIGLIDFIDRFGANTEPLHRMIDDLEQKRVRAGEHYLKGEYQKAWDTIEEAQEGLLEISAGLVPKEVENLLIAGSCISSEQVPFESHRAMAPIMAIGQAAGTAGALCSCSGTKPRSLNADLLRTELVKQGAELRMASEEPGS